MCVCVCVCERPCPGQSLLPVNVAEPCTARTADCDEERLPSILCDLCRPKVHRDLSTQWHTALGVCRRCLPPGLSWRGFCTHSSAGLAGGALCVWGSVSGKCLAVAWCWICLF